MKAKIVGLKNIKYNNKFIYDVVYEYNTEKHSGYSTAIIFSEDKYNIGDYIDIRYSTKYHNCYSTNDYRKYKEQNKK